MKTTKLETYAGETFSKVAEKAKGLASQKGGQVEFEFNSVKCFVNSETNTDWLYRDYSNSWIMGWKEVGPNCLEVYGPKLQAEFEEKTKLQEEKEAKQRAEWKAKDKAEEEALAELIKEVDLELKDAEGWNASREANNDEYGGAALDYAEAWARKMQIEIKAGKTVSECAEYCQEGLGFLGITGFQYGCAVSILSQTWKHGEELRVWHNGQYGHSGEGTVNPAVLTIK